MKKIVLALTLTALAGCQTATQMGSMAKAGSSALSCDQIYAAFGAYEKDRYSASAWMELIRAINPELDARRLASEYSAEDLYEQARLYANIALAVQGCRAV